MYRNFRLSHKLLYYVHMASYFPLICSITRRLSPTFENGFTSATTYYFSYILINWNLQKFSAILKKILCDRHVFLLLLLQNKHFQEMFLNFKHFRHISFIISSYFCTFTTVRYAIFQNFRKLYLVPQKRLFCSLYALILFISYGLSYFLTKKVDSESYLQKYVLVNCYRIFNSYSITLTFPHKVQIEYVFIII